MRRNIDKQNSNKSDQIVNLQEILPYIKHKYLVMSGKGCVGKSTVAVNLAVCLSMSGNKVRLMDIDLHGPDTLDMMGIDSVPLCVDDDKIVPLCYNRSLKAISIACMLPSPDTPVIWRGPMKLEAIMPFITDVTWGELDYLIIDSPPGTGDEPLTVAQQIPGSKSIIVTTPQAVSILDVRKSINFCRKMSMSVLGLVENMSGLVCPFCGKSIDLFGSGGGRETAMDMDIPYLVAIPIDHEIAISGDTGIPIVMSQPESETTRSINRIAQNIIEDTSVEKGEEMNPAGAFCHFKDIDCLTAIGLLPMEARNKIVKFGNGAFAGAINSLVNFQKRSSANTAIENNEHTKPAEIEKSDFLNEVADNTYFKKGA